MSITVWTTEALNLESAADTALKAAARFWFGVTVIGQLLFAFAVASFYGMAAVRGDHSAWSKFISHGYVPGDRAGNLAVAVHLASAVVIMLAGAVQLVPQVRSRFPVFHHWNGRIYMLTAVITSMAGLYMTWIRGSVGDLSQHLGVALAPYSSGPAPRWRYATLWLTISKLIAAGPFGCSSWSAPRGSTGWYFS